MILTAAAKPYPFSFDPTKTALLLSQSAYMHSVRWRRNNGDLYCVPS